MWAPMLCVASWRVGLVYSLPPLDCCGRANRRPWQWQAGDRGVVPAREEDMRAGTTPRSPAETRRLSESSPEREDSHAARNLIRTAAITSADTSGAHRLANVCRTRRCIRWALRAPCKFSGSAENLLRRLVSSVRAGVFLGAHVFFARGGTYPHSRHPPRLRRQVFKRRWNDFGRVRCS